MLVYAGMRVENFDFEIYRGAVTGMLHGNSVYAYVIHMPEYNADMGFIYPPFASLVMLPLALLPHSVAKILMAVTTAVLVMAALAGCFSIIDNRREAVGRKKLSLITWAWVSIPIGFAVPTVSNMQSGQVSFAIAALMLLDVMALPPRWRGVLVGVTGAIKLTPMILVPYYLVTRQWRAAMNASIAFGLATVVGAVFRWPDSMYYWLHPSVINNSLGNPARPDNWSIYGDLARVGLSGSTLQICWVIASALVLGFAAWRATKHFRRGQELEATLVMGISAALVTPATWPHHLLFGLVACALLAVRRPGIGIPALVGLTAVGYMATADSGLWVVALMAAFVIFGMPGNLHPSSERPRSSSWGHRSRHEPRPDGWAGGSGEGVRGRRG